MGTSIYVRSLCVEQQCIIFSTCNAERKVSKQNKRFIPTLSPLAKNGLPTGKALSVEIFFFLSFHSFNLRELARSVYSLYNKQVKIPY